VKQKFINQREEICRALRSEETNFVILELPS